MKKLTPTQVEVLSRITEMWQSAYELQASRATLNALVKKGLVQRRGGLGAILDPRTSIQYRRCGGQP